MTKEPFETEIPLGFLGPVKLESGALLGMDGSLNTMHSVDAGKTWNNSGPMVDGTGTEFPSGRYMPRGLIRLASGAIAVNYLRALPKPVGWRAYQAFLQKSLDEGKTWCEPVQITWDNTPVWPTFLVQTKSGRLVLPNEYVFKQSMLHHEHNSMKICTVFYSDDEGQTWEESADSVFVAQEDGAQIALVEAPCIAETADGRLLMFGRTRLHRLAQSYSVDGGQQWEAGSLNSLVSSCSEVWLSQIPETGDLLCVWNQATVEEIRTGFYRSRLSSAISKDSGKTWEHFQTVVMSPGMRVVDRVIDTPPAYVRASGVAPEQGPFPAAGHRTVRHPRVRFIDDKAYLRYDDRRYTQPHSKSSYFGYKLRILPVSWFYEGDASL